MDRLSGLAVGVVRGVAVRGASPCVRAARSSRAAAFVAGDADCPPLPDETTAADDQAGQGSHRESRGNQGVPHEAAGYPCPG